MSAVTRVDHRALHMTSNKCRATRDCGPDDDRIDPHRLDIACGINKRLALRGTGPARTEVDDVGTEPLCRDLKAHTRAGGILEEEVRDDTAREASLGAHISHRRRQQCFRMVKQSAKFRRRQTLDRKKVATRAREFGSVRSLDQAHDAQNSVRRARIQSPTAAIAGSATIWIGWKAVATTPVASSRISTFRR